MSRHDASAPEISEKILKITEILRALSPPVTHESLYIMAVELPDVAFSSFSCVECKSEDYVKHQDDIRIKQNVEAVLPRWGNPEKNKKLSINDVETIATAIENIGLRDSNASTPVSKTIALSSLVDIKEAVWKAFAKTPHPTYGDGDTELLKHEQSRCQINAALL